VPRVSIASEAICLDGSPAILLAGTFQYFYLPHADLWQPTLERFRMGGLNAVLVPVPWAYHSPAAGFHDFTGPRDLPRLFDEIERAGLWLLLHIGPWVGSGLAAGGVPGWVYGLPEVAARIAQGIPYGYRSPLTRHVSVWWDRVLTLAVDRPNLVAVGVDPGPGLGPDEAAGATGTLLTMLDARGISLPLAVADAGQFSWKAGLLELRKLVGEVPSAAVAPADKGGESLLRLALPFAAGARAAGIGPVHAGAPWGWWTPVDGPAVTGGGAPVAEGATLSSTYYRLRHMALALETMGTVLATSELAPALSANPPEQLLGGRTGAAGTVAFVRGRERSESFVDLTLSRDPTPIRVDDIPTGAGSIAVYPLDWQLADGRLLATSLEPVLHTTVAGRELLVFENPGGGEVLLPAPYRVRHRRGPVYVERAAQGVMVHFDPAKLGSVVLEGDGSPLQILALEPSLAERTWPLDDLWRTTPAYPAPWSEDGEQPARGIVIGVDFAIPEPDGGFRYQMSTRGFGYRWGPWRGSDPHTWLAPLSWPAVEPIRLPTLLWSSRPGAPEVLPNGDSHGWIEVSPERGLPCQAYGIDQGFVWYRGTFRGYANAVRLICRDPCDLYFNGAHIASLNPPPGEATPTTKTVPLPARHSRDANVLAALIQLRGRSAGRPWVVEPRGLVACELEGTRFDRWLVKGGLSGELRVQGFHGFAEWDLVDGQGTADITWHRTTFEVEVPENRESALYLYLDQTPAVSMVYLNGCLVGRVRYPQERQRRVWLPDGLLRRRGSNELLLAQWTRGADPGIGVARLESGPVWVWRTEGRRP